MTDPIPTDLEAPDEEPIPVDPDFPPEDPLPPEQEPVEPGPEMPVVGGWLDAAAQAEADAKQYTDEQVPLVAGRLVPRNMDRAPTVEDGADLVVGTGWNQYDPVTGDLVQMWRWDGAAWQALEMSAEMIPVLDIGSATVGDLTGGRINVQDGPIVAGDPAGARVELTGDGLHAYDATGAETARIQGEEGVFVGGEFRTSDTLPGQVTLSDTAYVTSEDGVSGPGIRIDPEDSSGSVVPPGIGPHGQGVRIDGGRSDTGRASWMHVDTTGLEARSRGTRSADPQSYMGTQSDSAHMGFHSGTFGEPGYRNHYIRVDANQVDIVGPNASINASQVNARMFYSDQSGRSGVLEAYPFHSRISHTSGGTTRTLRIDSGGVWVETNRTGTEEAYNLEETAQDSGWQPITLASGIAGAGSPAWRNKGGMIYFRGTATATWTTGWNTVATNLPAEMWPQVRVIQNAPSQSELGLLWRMGADGLLEFYKPNGGTRTGEFSGLFYPLG